MKSVITIFILLFLSSSGNSQPYRRYFFDDKLPVNDSTSLILIIRNPQTQFARELNCRIYTDTNFIRELKESWYHEVEDTNGRSGHACGHDLYFHSLSGDKYTYLNQLNSNCGITKVGCTNLNVLLQSGRPLHIDTITRLRMNSYRHKLFNDQLITSRLKSEKSWGYCKTNKYAKIYYEGSFRTEIYMDTNFTINENAESFVRKYTDDLEGVNWSLAKNEFTLVDGKKRSDVNSKKVARDVEIIVYLKTPKFDLFKEFAIQKIDFNVNFGDELILIYKD